MVPTEEYATKATPRQWVFSVFLAIASFAALGAAAYFTFTQPEFDNKNLPSTKPDTIKTFD